VTGNQANGKAAPFDLDAAVAAAAAEGKDQPFAFTYHGTRYEVPPSGNWSLTALDALSAGDLAGALAEMLGEDYNKLRDAGLKLGELNALIEAIGQESGFESLPNSGPPQRRVSTRT
jgi:hypothetical protein